MDRSMDCSHCSDKSDKSGKIRVRWTITTTSLIKLDTTCISEEYISTTKISPIYEECRICASNSDSANPEKDGAYFLQLLKDEQARLSALAATAENYLATLSHNEQIKEDTLGLLRLASGKARLLVSKKMKQFEDLCHKNLNPSPEDEFPTTLDDLQGFWDLTNLQVAQIDSIFEDIEKLKSNDWKCATELPNAPHTVSQMKSTKTSKSGILKAKASGDAMPYGKGTGNGSNSKPLGALDSAAVKREEQRKQLLEMRRQRREALAAANKTEACDAAGGDGGSNTNGVLQEILLLSNAFVRNKQ